ncbi:SbcC-like subunit of palindrome specific endonuclease [Synechococcus phage S-SRM01]|uniref:Recombination endonuclease subunit n=1 Tax=Synechococcus phage S-SRM01 TaxID=2781608 RepID=A0A879R1X5_9CAUD|nr:SbcC-like subunit of palindrome specific endonuclease [Synechococcus phage S-SRM01]QPX48193.1 recombination endonuclease subunit [Synechococcus phage S-SRM01]
MLVFHKIRWRNFLSTGNQFSEIDFEKNHTNLIIGTNGAGKSTVLDALTFVLFNRPFRKINKPQLANTTNEKDCLVEIEFTVNNRDYLVRRGIKPNIFDIEVNGVPLHKEADDRANQKILEENILKVNYKSFTQIVILGSSTFVPFMQLTTAHRREVIEDLLDIRIFSAMNSLIKDKIREKKDQIKSLDLKKETLKDKMRMQESFIEELESRGNANINANQEKIAKLDAEVGIYMTENARTEEDIFKYTKEQEEVLGAADKLVKLNNLKGKISQKVSVITKEHKFFTENTVCPTCTQTIEEEFRLNRIKDAQNKAKELQKGYQDLEETIKLEQERERQFTVLSKEITKLNHEISQNNTRISLNQRQIRDLESEIQTLTQQLKNRNTEHEKLEEFRENLQKTFEDLSKKKEEIVYYDFAYSLLKDDGVKTKIIKKYLPFINQQVNRYLQMMDFYINFHLDEEFNETVKSPIHEDFSYSSFSEGEKMRIDLALLFTWREVARVKNSVNTNLLIMDEVFDSSLDGFGTDEFLKIIRYVIKDANIFVISHKSDLHDKFESVLRFEKVKGFSRMMSQQAQD